MDPSKKTSRMKMGLLRQQQIEQVSIEKTPLLNKYELSKFQCENESKLIKTDKTATAVNRNASLAMHSTLHEQTKNKDEKSVTTFRRALLHQQWSSSASLDKITPTSEEEKPLLPPSPTHSELTKGLICAIIGAGVMYGLSGVFVRLAGENGVSSVETLFVRSFVQTTLFGGLSVAKKLSFRPTEGKFWYWVLITVWYSLATICSFEAFNVIPPGSAIATRGASRTIFAILFTFLLTNEKIMKKDVIAIATCVAGISCIIASSLTTKERDGKAPVGMADNRILVNVYGYALIVFAGVTRCLGLITVRRMKGSIHTFVVVFYHASMTLLVTFILLFCFPLKWPPSVAGIAYTLTVCVTSSIATWSSNRAVQLIHPGLVALGQNADLVVSIILEHTLLHLLPSVLEILGAIFILCGVSGITFLRWKESKDENNQDSSSNAK